MVCGGNQIWGGLGSYCESRPGHARVLDGCPGREGETTNWHWREKKGNGRATLGRDRKGGEEEKIG